MSSRFSQEPLRQSRAANLDEQLEYGPQSEGVSQKEPLLKSTPGFPNSSRENRVPHLNSSNILRLQQTVGNQAVQLLIKNQKAGSRISAFRSSSIGIVGRLITIFSGGVAAIAGESLTILKNIVSMAQKAFRAVKGIYKYVRGTKGKNRAISARPVQAQAAGGSVPAARVLQNMDLWGKVQQAKGAKGKITREGNTILKAISEQPKDPSGAPGIISILETKYTPADEKVKKVVDEKVASNLKSS